MKGRLNIKSTFDRDACVEYSAEADVEVKKGAVFITYLEDQADYAETTAKIGISADLVTLTRLGKFPAFFLFSIEQKHLGKITTIFGEVDVLIKTERLDVDIGEHSVTVDLRYETLIADAAGVCEMSLRCDF